MLALELECSLASRMKGATTSRLVLGLLTASRPRRNISERLGGLQTNNRAELMVCDSCCTPAACQTRTPPQAAIRALEVAPTTVPVRLYTDSKYCIMGATEWLKEWRKNNWNKKVRNRTLFERLDELLCQREPPIEWVTPQFIVLATLPTNQE